MSNIFGATGVSGAGFGAFAPDAPADPNQPAWMTSFQTTLDEILDKGFRGYAKDLNDQKLAELRKKILEGMGLSEEKLEKMSPESRAAIDRMIAEEIRERVTAEAALKEGKGAKTGQDTGPRTPQDAERESIVAQAASNGMGAGLTLIRAMETVKAETAELDPENRQ